MNNEKIENEFINEIVPMLNDGIVDRGVGEDHKYFIGGAIVERLWQWIESKLSEAHKQEWISTKNALPEDKQDIIVTQAGTHESLFASFDKANKRFLVPGGTADGIHLANAYYTNILFWQPKPEPPKEAKDDGTTA